METLVIGMGAEMEMSTRQNMNETKSLFGFKDLAERYGVGVHRLRLPLERSGLTRRVGRILVVKAEDLPVLDVALATAGLFARKQQSRTNRTKRPAA
jgi:hypothetical protein